MNVAIEGTDLPGRHWCGRDNVHVGVQRRSEVVELRPADAGAVRWELDIGVVDTDDAADFRGPFVQGRRGARFIYLSWGTVDGDGSFAMFRRAKLMLDGIDPAVLVMAKRPGARLVARLALTGADGGPRCAAVRPPGIEWSAAG